MPDKVSAIKFLVAWSDGSTWTAEGEIAAKIMEWYQSGESMNLIHGFKYSGPQVTITPEPEGIGQ